MVSAVRDKGTSSTGKVARRPYLVVSGDSHAGPSLEQDLRPYCPKKYLAQFDAFAADHREAAEKSTYTWNGGATMAVSADQARESTQGFDAELLNQDARREGLAQMARVLDNPGTMNAEARLRDMDEQGVASELIFAGAQNREVLPWAGGLDAGSASVDPELRALGGHLWNEWLADFCATAPERLLGVAQIPIWDIPGAVKEIHWAKQHGLRAINFPAPRPDYPAYNERVYEPFWSAVEEVGLPLVTHVNSGEVPSGAAGKGAILISTIENLWLSRRGLAQMIFGEVFDRFPTLTVAFVEQRGNWVQQTLNDLDSLCLGATDSLPHELLGIRLGIPKRLPSEYWKSNCILADSSMAPYEAAMRHEIALETLMWGSDYPHIEGTWPRTKLALRNTFAGIPEDDVRTILGANGVRAFNLDTTILQPIADRIGPTPQELAVPLAPDEFPAYRGFSFRRNSSYR